MSDETRVVDAFVKHLVDEGWSVRREVDHVDVVATRDETTMYAEAKGRTKAQGLDVDTLYGQLLRRVPEDASTSLLAVVVPDTARAAALRVPVWVRERLRIQVYTVSERGDVELVAPGADRGVVR